MSQIGYMFLGAGIGAYANAMFLLMAHAFFKALLFLGAGIVIHALHGEQDIRKMGGLRKLMPKTWWAMLIGGLALAGIPPLSGFFAKDSILAVGARPRRLVRLHCSSPPASSAPSSPASTRSGCCSSSSAASSPRTCASTRRTRATTGLVELVDGPDGRRARGARRRRRLDPGRRSVDGGDHLARSGRASRSSRRPARRRWSRASAPSLARPRRHRRRLVDLLGAPGEGAAPVGRARAQVLLRRAVQRPLLLAGGRVLARPRLDGRGPGRERLDPRRRRTSPAAPAAGSASSRPASCACTCSRWPPGSPSSSSSSSR